MSAGQRMSYTVVILIEETVCKLKYINDSQDFWEIFCSVNDSLGIIFSFIQQFHFLLHLDHIRKNKYLESEMKKAINSKFEKCLLLITSNTYY